MFHVQMLAKFHEIAAENVAGDIFSDEWKPQETMHDRGMQCGREGMRDVGLQAGRDGMKDVALQACANFSDAFVQAQDMSFAGFLWQC